MNGANPRASVAPLVIRWVARGWSLLSLGFVGLIVVGEVIHPTATVPITPPDLIGLSLFPFGTCLGMLLAWCWEGLGGAITVRSLVAFYLVMFIMDGKFPGKPPMRDCSRSPTVLTASSGPPRPLA